MFKSISIFICFVVLSTGAKPTEEPPMRGDQRRLAQRGISSITVSNDGFATLQEPFFDGHSKNFDPIERGIFKFMQLITALNPISSVLVHQHAGHLDKEPPRPKPQPVAQQQDEESHTGVDLVDELPDFEDDKIPHVVPNIAYRM